MTLTNGDAILALQNQLKAKQLEIQGLNAVHDRLVQRKKESDYIAESLSLGMFKLEEELTKLREAKTALEKELAETKRELYSTLEHRARYLLQEAKTTLNTLVDRVLGR